MSTNALSANTHVIGLRVEDEVGALCVDEILVNVGEEPTVSIVAPQSGEVVSLGIVFFFNGVLNDAEDSVTTLAVSWESSTTGQIANTRFTGISSVFTERPRSRRSYDYLDRDGFYRFGRI